MIQENPLAQIGRPPSSRDMMAVSHDHRRTVWRSNTIPVWPPVALLTLIGTILVFSAFAIFVILAPFSPLQAWPVPNRSVHAIARSPAPALLAYLTHLHHQNLSVRLVTSSDTPIDLPAVRVNNQVPVTEGILIDGTIWLDAARLPRYFNVASVEKK